MTSCVASVTSSDSSVNSFLLNNARSRVIAAEAPLPSRMSGPLPRRQSAELLESCLCSYSAFRSLTIHSRMYAGQL